MEGPTPVSALIHAATMVTAGVYMIGRNAMLFEHAPITLDIVAVIGAATALFAGTIGLVQNDIKRVLAYSTVSQLGYMFLAMGVGAFGAGIFHLFTHAFFKALLFLGSGAVIHALHGEQDIRHMGGLKKHLPITYWTFLIGALAIAGVPLLAGFFSKDEILFETFRTATDAVGGRRPDVAADGDLHVPAGVPDVPRRRALRHGARRHTAHGHARLHLTHRARHRADVHPRHACWHGGHACAPPRCAAGDGLALIVLAVGSVLAGYIGDSARARRPATASGRPGSSRRSRPTNCGARHRRAPVRENCAAGLASMTPRTVQPAAKRRARSRGEHDESAPRAHADGGLVADCARRHRPGRVPLAEEPPHPRRRWRSSSGVHKLLLNKYYVDEVYDAAIVQPIKVVSTQGLWQASTSSVVDGAVNGAGYVVGGVRAGLRLLQTGSVKSLRGGDVPRRGGHPRLLHLEIARVTGLPILSLAIGLPSWGRCCCCSSATATARRTALIRNITLGVSLLTFAVTLALWAGFDPSPRGAVPVRRAGAVDPAFGIEYYLGIDGLSLMLIVLTGFLTPIALLTSWESIEKKVKEFSIFMLLLETAMIGVFCSLDLFLFYVFWDIMLIPMYFLIGIWGYDQRIYAAVKFILYTLAGSVLMLIAIIGLSWMHQAATGQYSFDLLKLYALQIPVDTQVLVLPRLRDRVRDQGAAVPVPHLAARRARRGADARLGDPGRRAAEDGRLRPHPLRVPAVPRGGAVLRAADRRRWR